MLNIESLITIGIIRLSCGENSIPLCSAFATPAAADPFVRQNQGGTMSGYLTFAIVLPVRHYGSVFLR